jgi:hypothetical protein
MLSVILLNVVASKKKRIPFYSKVEEGECCQWGGGKCSQDLMWPDMADSVLTSEIPIAK